MADKPYTPPKPLPKRSLLHHRFRLATLILAVIILSPILIAWQLFFAVREIWANLRSGAHDLSATKPVLLHGTLPCDEHDKAEA